MSAAVAVAAGREFVGSASGISASDQDPTGREFLAFDGIGEQWQSFTVSSHALKRARDRSCSAIPGQRYSCAGGRALRVQRQGPGRPHHPASSGSDECAGGGGSRTANAPRHDGAGSTAGSSGEGRASQFHAPPQGFLLFHLSLGNFVLLLPAAGILFAGGRFLGKVGLSLFLKFSKEIPP